MNMDTGSVMRSDKLTASAGYCDHKLEIRPATLQHILPGAIQATKSSPESAGQITELVLNGKGQALRDIGKADSDEPCDLHQPQPFR